MNVKLAIAASALALLTAAPAFATITIFSSPPFPPNPPENVLLNDSSSGLTVLGTTNNTGTKVTFTGTETLTEPANGQARIEATDGSFNALTIGLQNPTLGTGAFEFNIDATANGTINLLFFDQFGTSFGGNFAVGGSGSNFFNAVASGGEVIKTVQLTGVGGTTFADVAQVRLGGFSTIGVIPEPGSWALMILGFGGVGAALRHRRRTPALA
jgi:hypothetical protein